MQEKIDATLRQQLARFRAGRSCVDHIVTLRIFLEQINETQECLYLVVIDYEKAFDSLTHANMCEALRRNGLPEKIIGLIEAQYRAFRTARLGCLCEFKKCKEKQSDKSTH